MELSEQIQDARQGNAAAQKYLFDRLSDPMMALCCRYVKNREDAEEVLLDGLAGSSADKVFELPPRSIDKRIRIDLGKGNLLFLEMGALSDVRRFSNIDSLLLVFLADMKAFRDSLSDPLTIKRIDYVMDLSGRKRIRILQTRAQGSSFLLEKGDLAALKLEQDTIHIQMVSVAPPGGKGAEVGGLRYDRLSFIINQYSELETFVTTGLNAKLALLQQTVKNNNPGYHRTTRRGRLFMDADPSISMANNHEGEEQTFGNQLSLFANVNAQNYKNYFTPSFALGAAVSLNPGANKHTFTATWEPMFFFSSDAQGHKETLRNDFFVLSYMERRIGKMRRPVGMPLFLSLGYLISRQGDVFEKRSFRFSADRLDLFHGSVSLEPCIYFHDFVRDVTPGIRLSVAGIF